MREHIDTNNGMKMYGSRPRLHTVQCTIRYDSRD